MKTETGNVMKAFKNALILCVVVGWALLWHFVIFPTKPEPKPEPETLLTDAQKTARGCKVVYLTTYRKPMSEWTQENFDLVTFCKVQGLYHNRP